MSGLDSSDERTNKVQRNTSNVWAAEIDAFFTKISKIDFVKICDKFDTEDDEQYLAPIRNAGYIRADVAGDGSCGYYSALLGLCHLRKWDIKKVIKNGYKEMYVLRTMVSKFLQEKKWIFLNTGVGSLKKKVPQILV